MKSKTPESTEFLGKVLREYENALDLFPSHSLNTIALMEEVGEPARALLDETKERIVEEAIQVAALAMKIALHGDDSVDRVRGPS